jgi:PAS domain S-box-containing protein
MEKILIVDSLPIDARMTATLLTKSGYTTTLVNPGENVLKVAHDQRPDLILLSVALPVEDGYQMCQQLKTNRTTRYMTVVLYTVRGESLDFLRGIEVGADDFLLTPLTDKNVPARVKEILAERHMSFPGFSEPLNLVLTQLSSTIPDQRVRVDLFFSAFSRHALKGINIMLSDFVGDVLVNRAVEKTAIRFPFFPDVMKSHISGSLMESPVIDTVSVTDVMEGFRTFIHALYRLVVIITRTRPNRVQEMRVISRAFEETLTDLQARSEELQNRTGQTEDDERAKDDQVAIPADASSPSGQPSPASPLRLDCTIDARGHLISCHDGLIRMLGYNKDELMGRPLAGLLVGDGRQTLNPVFDSLIATGVARTYFHLKTKDGSSIHADAHFTATYDANGRLAMAHGDLQVLSVSLVIQEQAAENELLRRDLHDLREQFTLLSSILARDLNQPLGDILSLCETFRTEHQGLLNESAQTRLQSIEQTILKAKELTQGIADYAQMAGTPNVYSQANLDHLIEEVRATLSLTLIQRRAVFRVVGELPTITCDRERIKWLFMELANNALKFNKAISPTIEIGVEKNERDGCTFHVKDNGIGIEAASHESVFRLFYRLPQSKTYSGTGIGLATCRRIVESHGGRIWVQSKPGAGATVFFTLPRHA